MGHFQSSSTLSAALPYSLVSWRWFFVVEAGLLLGLAAFIVIAQYREARRRRRAAQQRISSQR